ncbi:hypothetical protein GQ43DRAFT_382858 [Delitschia confertaspora ATCC 74209]|uniref:laccase n=1 Tax=Delitschia confertaspora ATCC 74209 TaxID=1513339 RepID=A0A9P4JEY1_9PLEO|nr:hypothetical protein GQ43DRAFT_382858 [Delitschia confertaspora ATCC 74209]
MTPKTDLVVRQDAVSSPICINSPTSRNCWAPGFDINTNVYTKTPTTAQTKSFDLSITNTTCNPDGNGARVCMLINNQYPGPTITANWGDTIRVTLRNKLQHNGTSIHWHGIRQVGTNPQDGANGITECALAPGDVKTYQFRATEYGTSWYHSHFSGQYGDGVVGSIVVNGPASANYDIDLGPYQLTDWYYITAFQAGARAALGGAPPQGNNILVNGKNKNANGGGSYDVRNLTPGKKHRLRLINTSVDTQLRVSLDGHAFQVISTDFVPVQPFTTNWLLMGIGQRYDVIITANQTSGNYWLRAEAEGNCQSSNAGVGRSIFRYTGASATNPTSNPLTGTPTSCFNQDATPVVALNVPSAAFTQQAQTLPVAFGPVTVNGQNLVLWTVSGSSMVIDWAKPTLKYIAENNASYPSSYNIINVPQANQWTYWIVQQAAGAPPIAHPIHLHGHDAYLLGSGTGTFSAANIPQLKFTNPVRRDVAMLPASGWLVLAYPSDNPGAWLMHCHIAFHVSMGLSVQFLERKSEINLPAPGSEWYQTCTKFQNYLNSKPVYPQEDSGLRKL